MPTQHGWERLHAFLSRCGQVHVPHDFVCTALASIDTLVPYDQARAYFLDDDFTVYDEFLMGVSKKITRDYHETYADVDESAYSTTRIAREWSYLFAKGSRPLYEPVIMDWEREPHGTRFYREHLAKQRLRFCMGFCLFDLEGRIRVLCTLDRLERSGRYTASECELMGLANRALDAMYRNFYVQPPIDHVNAIALGTSGLPLTPREVEVSKLMLRGLSAKGIAGALGISTPTVRKHIANMHKKLGVSGQAGLIRKLNSALLSKGV